MRFIRSMLRLVWNPVLPARVLSAVLVSGQGYRGKLDEAGGYSILIVRLDDIGDLVLTSPFLRELRASFPTAWITLVVNSTVYNLVELCPHVNEVVHFEPLPNAGKLRNYIRALRFSESALMPRRFDLALFPRWDFDHTFSSLLIYLSRAQRRIAYSEAVNPAKREKNRGYDRFFTEVLLDTSVRHEVEYSLEMLRRIGGTVRELGLEVWTNAADEETANEFLKRHGVPPSAMLVAICPGAKSPRRQWPLEKYRSLCATVCDTFGAFIVIVGGPGEEGMGESLATGTAGRVINAAGGMSLRQTASLLRHAAVFIGGDSGLLHLAAGVGLKIVEISCHPMTGTAWHPNSPVRFSPWNTPHAVIRPKSPLPPCVENCDSLEAHCIKQVSLEEVQEALTNLLQT